MNAKQFPAELPRLTLETSPAKTDTYAALTNDYNPLHVDAEFAANTPFGKPIAHGTMALNLLMAAIGKTRDPAFCAGDVSIKFTAPTPVGETLTTHGVLSDAATGLYDVAVTTDSGVDVLKGTIRVVTRN